MHGESKPGKPSIRARQRSSEGRICTDKVAKADEAAVPLAPATSLPILTSPVKHKAPPSILNNKGSSLAANKSSATQVGSPLDDPRDPAAVLQSEVVPKDGAKERVGTTVQAPAAAAQGRHWRRRRKSRPWLKSREGSVIQPDITSHRKKRRAKRRKSRATAAEAGVLANEERQPIEVAGVGGEDEKKEGSKSSDVRPNVLSKESVSNAYCAHAAARTDADAVDAAQASARRSETQVETGACGKTESKKFPKSCSTVKVPSPPSAAQPSYSKRRRGSETAQMSSAMSGINEGIVAERHGKKKSLSEVPTAYSYSTLLELATSLKTYTTPARLEQGSQRMNDNDLQRNLPFLFLFAVVFVSVVTLLLWLMDRRFQHAMQGVCVSPACAELSAAFHSVLNYSVDPCDDLDAFVCSKGLRRGYGARSGGRSAQSVIEQVIRDYELRMVKLFVDGETTFTASAMVAEFLHQCIHGWSETPSSIESFRELFAYASVPWPFDPPASSAEVHPLEAVLGLTLKWGIDTWFRAYLHTVGRTRLASNFSHSPALFIEAGAQASSWLNFVRTLASSNNREKYYRFFYARYNATPPESDDITRELAVEKDVLTTVDAARPLGSGPRTVVATIAKIADAVANTSLENWLNPIIAAPGGSSVDSRTMAAVKDVRVLRAVQRLMNTYTADTLTRHLSWWLVQILTVVGWPQGYDVIAGSQEAARSEVKLECYRIMADRFGLLMASESAVKLFDRKSRQEVTDFFMHIITLLAGAVAKAPWLSEGAKDGVARMLQDLEIIVWPPEEDESNATLSALYADFCSACKQSAESEGSTAEAPSPATNSTLRPLLMDYWWQVSKKFWDLSPNQREHMQLLWQEHQFEALRYEPWNNRLHVSHAALSSLLYHPESADRRTANFGGLGAAFVLTVLQMFELPAADFNTDIAPQPVADVRDIFSRAEYLNCSEEFMANVRDVFAMGLAWQALKVEEKSAKKLHGRHFKQRFMIAIKDENSVEHLYGGDQLFFLTYCRSRCVAHRQLGMERGPGCNAAVRGTADFGRAFKCDVGTPMVPRNVCQVSDFF